MENKTFGDNIDKVYDRGLEALSKFDIASARNINRPLNNLFEKQKEIYKLLNKVLKSVYGKYEKSILKNIYEDFSPDRLELGKVGENTYLRIPTGVFFGKTDKYPSDDIYSCTNFPDTDIIERTFAKLIDLDLSDQENDIIINQHIMPKVTSFPVYNTDGSLCYDASGDIEYVSSEEDKRLYECTKENASHAILRSNKIKNKYKLEDPNSIEEKDNDKYIFLTDNYLNASSSEEKMLCYTASVSIVNSYQTITNYLPNKEKNAGWIIQNSFFDNLPASSGNRDIKIVISSDTSINLSVSSSCLPERINYLIMDKINSTDSIISAKNYDSNSILIYFKENDYKNNDKKLTIKVDNNPIEKVNDRPVDENNEQQEYYRDIFELYNGLKSEYKNYINISTNNMYKYMVGETLIPFDPAKPVEGSSYGIYYNISDSPKEAESSDKSGKFLLIKTPEEPVEEDKDLIKLFSFDISDKSINNISRDPSFKVIDNEETINTYNIDIDNLTVNKETTLTGITTIQDDTKGTNKIEVKDGGVTSTGNTTIINDKRSIILNDKDITLSETNDTEGKTNTIKVDKDSVNISGTGGSNEKSINVNKENIELRNDTNNGITLDDTSVSMHSSNKINNIKVDETEVSISGNKINVKNDINFEDKVLDKLGNDIPSYYSLEDRTITVSTFKSLDDSRETLPKLEEGGKWVLIDTEEYLSQI